MNEVLPINKRLKAPFPWFGGKSRAAALMWPRLGDVYNYVEPFAGSLAVLLARPHEAHTETVNDMDGGITNAWRALKLAPDAVVEHADNPVHELDLHARHQWCVNRMGQTAGIEPALLARAAKRGLTPFAARLEADPEFHDARLAGYWIWGLSSWIGDSWCRVQAQESIPHLGCAGKGVNRKIPILNNGGEGVNKASGGDTCGARREWLLQWFRALSDRLRTVRICCGDFERVLGPSVTFAHGVTGVFLDPPYAESAGVATCYQYHGNEASARTRKWSLANGDNKLLRIALCGYDGEHVMPDSWECVEWKACGGYGMQRKDKSNVNAHRERIWFSPHCLKLVC